jgi:hypothetical protein
MVAFHAFQLVVDVKVTLARGQSHVQESYASTPSP